MVDKLVISKFKRQFNEDEKVRDARAPDDDAETESWKRYKKAEQGAYDEQTSQQKSQQKRRDLEKAKAKGKARALTPSQAEKDSYEAEKARREQEKYEKDIEKAKKRGKDRATPIPERVKAGVLEVVEDLDAAATRFQKGANKVGKAFAATQFAEEAKYTANKIAKHKPRTLKTRVKKITPARPPTKTHIVSVSKTINQTVPFPANRQPTGNPFEGRQPTPSVFGRRYSGDPFQGKQPTPSVFGRKPSGNPFEGRQPTPSVFGRKQQPVGINQPKKPTPSAFGRKRSRK